MTTGSPIEIDSEIQVALGLEAPVVALESAVLTHGLLYPANVEALQRMRAAVRARGVTPAVIAVIEGKIRIGISADDIERLAAAEDTVKIARRDLPLALARGSSGGTTVSASLAVAHAAGLPVLATGGIGGVHLGAGRTWDISADLDELSRRPVVVVCSGTKAICDPAATLEALDTRGVLVGGYRTGRFPLFYVADSGCAVPWEVLSIREVTAVYLAKRRLADQSAVVVANPPPPEAALRAETVRAAVDQALAQAHDAGVRGGDLTPFLLSEIDRRTGGRAVPANLALLEANAALGAQIAAALAEERLPT